MKSNEKENKQNTNTREAGMMAVTGIQGVGKTYQNMHIIANYVKDKPKTRVRGRKCLIFDTNGEYTQDQFGKNGVPNFKSVRIALKDVPLWCKTEVAECRRIDAKNLTIKEKKDAVEYLLKVYKNGMLVLEDINTYILSVTFMEQIVGGIVNLRHRGVDVMISYQSLRPVEPRIWQNSRWVRFHYQADNVNHIKNKVPNLELMKIAQNIVNEKYFGGDRRFFLFVHNFANKIQGNFTKEEFANACRKYLNANKREVKEYANSNECSMEEALEGKCEQLYQEYYYNG